MPISKRMEPAVTGSSLVRKMFEEGARLKAQFGADEVFDYSLGNPDLAPPSIFHDTLLKVVTEDIPGSHAYMPNAGWPQVRQQVADFLNKDQGRGLKNSFAPNNVIMTVGAAGAINILFRAIIDPGDEVISPKPCFVEYGFYTENYGGILKMADCRDDFSLDIEKIKELINPKTKAVLINSPHNPTGVVYSEQQLKELASVLTEASQKYGRPIILVADEPYRQIAFDGVTVPSIFPLYPYSVVVTSYSKSLSIPGERLGYAAICPDMPEADSLFNAMSITNRILGFVSAPSLMQLVVGKIQGLGVDPYLYQKRRDILVDNLKKSGYELTIPQGSFYLFPKSPIEDDLAFVNILKEKRILAVPGRAFSAPGYFRLCYCLPEEMIVKSLKAFHEAIESVKK